MRAAAALPTPEHERPLEVPPLARPGAAAARATTTADTASSAADSASLNAHARTAGVQGRNTAKSAMQPPRAQAAKAEDSYPSPPHATTPPRHNKMETTMPLTPDSIPLPSFVDTGAMSASEDDLDSSSDEDECGDPKPPRPQQTSKSTGLPRPRPSYYYDGSYDAGTAGPKKRLGRRGGMKGVPVFEPSMEDFEGNGGFYGYVKRIEKYGLRSGIVKVIPPKEWSDSLPSVSEPLRAVRLREAIEQHMVGSSGLYRVMNEAKSRTWNAAQWKQRATMPRSDAPDVIADEKRGERSERTTVSGNKRRRSAAAAAAATAAGDEPRGSAGQGETGEEAEAAGAAADDEGEGEGTSGSPKERRAPARKAKDSSAPEPADAKSPPTAPAKRGRGRPPMRAEPTDEEWTEFTASLYDLPHGMKKEDYTVERLRDFERRYWRTLTFGEAPMYGADMSGTLFTDETKAWNVARLGDLLPKLAPSNCEIPGVVSPYLYFGTWRATFAWHVEDADLYSINYLHFGAPKFWYSVPQEQAERFERVMEGMFPTDRSKCSQFLRHKAFLASPRNLSNHGITLNRCAQLPGEFVLTYPKGYHSGFNLGFNCAEAVNFATERWLPLGKVAKHCHCIDDSVSIDVNIWLRQAAKEEALARGEVWPYDDLEEQAAAEAEEAAEREKEVKVEAKKRAAETAALPAAQQARKKAKPTPTHAHYLTPLQRQHVILTPAMPGAHASSIVTMTLYQAVHSPDILDAVKAQLNQLLHHPSGQWGVHSQIRLQAVPNPNPRPAYLDLPPPPAPPSNPYANSAFQYYPPGARHAPPRSATPQNGQVAAPPAPAAPAAPVPPPQPEWPCALCPDRSEEGLVRIGEPGQRSKKNLKAHSICVTFTPATWIEADPETGEDLVRGFGKIEKARWKLKCQLCSEMHGTKIQCTKGKKCAKAFHVTCALQEGSGIFLDATVPDGEPAGAAAGDEDRTDPPSAPAPPPSHGASTPVPLDGPADAASTGAPGESAAEVPPPPPASPAKASNDFVVLTVLCRTHNPDWQRQEAERRNTELISKIDALKPGERIRVKTNNGNYDVSFDRVEREKELLFFSFDDGKRSSVKWKNVIWPDSPEVLRKKQEKALRAEREKMAIFDRPAYRAPVKRMNTPADQSVPDPYPGSGVYHGAPAAPAPYQPYAGPHNPQLQQAYGYPSGYSAQAPLGYSAQPSYASPSHQHAYQAEPVRQAPMPVHSPHPPPVSSASYGTSSANPAHATSQHSFAALPTSHYQAQYQQAYPAGTAAGAAPSHAYEYPTQSGPLPAASSLLAHSRPQPHPMSNTLPPIYQQYRSTPPPPQQARLSPPSQGGADSLLAAAAAARSQPSHPPALV